MKYAPQYLQSAMSIVNQYNGDVPLAAYLRNYFAQSKKFGSKDRKWIAHLCYTYYRLGHVLKELPVEERLRMAIFLCHDTPDEWQVLFDPHWLAAWSNDVEERLAFIKSFYPLFFATAIFPWEDQLSNGIEWKNFSISHLIQPDLFLRIRPGKEKTVVQKLTTAQIPFQQLSTTCLALPNASKIDTILEIDQEVVIQDYSSQRIAEFLLTPYPLLLTPHKVWDCCAASGGKSILAKDVLGKIDLTVSDIRPSILRNLKQRFERAGIKNYESFVSDAPNTKHQTSNYQLILCDAPCTGSGTWGRTPEQLFFFTEETIHEYAALQAKIIRGVVPRLAKDGYLLYITCSVFKNENEAMVDLIGKSFPELQLVKAELLQGDTLKADSMFAALFKRSVPLSE